MVHRQRNVGSVCTWSKEVGIIRASVYLHGTEYLCGLECFNGRGDMKAKANWEKTQRAITSTIREMYKEDTQFVSSQFISEKLFEEKAFPDATYRTIVIRTTTVLKEHLKWDVFANKSKGPIFIVPGEFWGKKKCN
jgi:hypothetical protein